jgi:SAM-dependent methyltransferase
LEDISFERERYYKEHTLKYDANSSCVVGWFDGKENQLKRFQTLIDIGVKSGDSVLDVGCGTGHLVEYFKKNNIKTYYTGIDTNEVAIKIAQRIHYFDESYMCGDIFDVKEIYDWGLISGVFNYRFPKVEMLKSIAHLIEKVNKGIAFNVLKGEIKKVPEYTYYSPEEIHSYFKQYTIQIIENYGVEDDFTVWITK